MKYYRTYNHNGEDREVSVEAEDELDAETEFFYIEQGLTKPDEEFEWTSPIYSMKDKVQLSEKR